MANSSPKAVYDPGPDVTIVITCHNYGRFLSEAIESAIFQTVPCRVIVIDDASTDDTADVAVRFPGVDYRRVEMRDSSLTRNAGLADVTTPWVLFLDADNYLEPDAVQCLLAVARDEPVTTAVIYLSQLAFGDYRKLNPALPYDDARLDHENYIDNCALIRTDALRQVGGYREPRTDARGGTHEDWGLWLTLRRHGWGFAPAPSALLHYRCHDVNQHKNDTGQTRNTLLRCARIELLTIFAGRAWALPRYIDWLGQMDCDPAAVAFTFVDNSGDEDFGVMLQLGVMQLTRFSDVRIVRVNQAADPSGEATNAAYAGGAEGQRLAREDAIHAHLAALYSAAFARAQGEFVWCVEDDVIPPADCLPRLIKAFSERPKAAAVSALVRSRFWAKDGPTEPISGIFGDGPYFPRPFLEKDLVLKPASTSPFEPLVPAQWMGGACVLWRRRALEQVRPRFHRRPDGQALYWDVSVAADLAGAGHELLLHPGAVCQHFREDGTFA